MLDWLDSVTGPGYGAAILWTAGALVLLVIVLIIVKMIRSLTFGTFVAGGRNRKTRLAVMDATAVDSHRRLVLIRRDDVEHLLLIGGPTDLVVERDIRPKKQASEPSSSRPAPSPVVSRAQTIVTPQQRLAGTQGHHVPRQEVASTHAATNNKAGVKKSGHPKHDTSGHLDSEDAALMDELTLSLDEVTMDKSLTKAPSPSLDDEMAKLLGEISSVKR